jgi:hypothetical protein
MSLPDSFQVTAYGDGGAVTVCKTVGVVGARVAQELPGGSHC